MNWLSELDRMLAEEQSIVEDSFLGDLIEEDEKKKHGRPKLKDKSTLFDKCMKNLSESMERLREIKSKELTWKR